MKMVRLVKDKVGLVNNVECPNYVPRGSVLAQTLVA